MKGPPTASKEHVYGLRTKPLSGTRGCDHIGSTLSRFDDLAALFETIAESMTEAIRTSPNNTAFDGVGLNTVTYISISWAWLALPVAVVVLAFAMLVTVIVRNSNRGVPAWKSSGLALLFHELEGWGKEDLRVTGPEDMQILAGKMWENGGSCGGL